MALGSFWLFIQNFLYRFYQIYQRRFQTKYRNSFSNLSIDIVISHRFGSHIFSWFWLQKYFMSVCMYALLILQFLFSCHKTWFTCRSSKQTGKVWKRNHGAPKKIWITFLQNCFYHSNLTKTTRWSYIDR